MKTSVYGDVHGKIDSLIRKINASDSVFNLQLGDMGFRYKDLGPLDARFFKFFGGNHDNMMLYYDSPYSLGDYGLYTLGSLEFFYIRGAFSIDHMYRTPYIDLWPEEQLSEPTSQNAFDSYLREQPKVMITHTCPKEISDMIGNPQILKNFGYDPETFTTHTQELLQECFEVHHPETWIFGHFHRNLDFEYEGTRFICLNELCSVEYEHGCFTNNNEIEKI